MPLPPFHDVKDPDEKRREIVWIAISFIVILASWLCVVLLFGYQPLILGMTYDEVVLLSGLGLLLLCSVLYMAAREREQRSANQGLLRRYQGAVGALDEQLEHLNGLCATSAELAGSLDLDHISQCVAEAAVEALGASAASVILVDPETGRTLCERSSPVSGDGGPDFGLRWSDLAFGRPAPGRESAAAEPWNADRTAIGAPLHLANGVVGALIAGRSEGAEPFHAGELSLLTTLANMAAKAAESALLHQELRESYLATVRSLVNSLHERDNYSASHSARVAALAVRMAEHLGLPQHLIRDIEVFGPLHDVGKIGIRDSVLMKTEPLSEAEKAVCREHCAIGERILRPLHPSREALGMVRHHHEKWDGGGYPGGLAGEDIPRLARILQVADTYDAMVSERPYQPAMSEQEVLGHLLQHAGRLYDADAVAALCAVTGAADDTEGVESARAEGGIDDYRLELILDSMLQPLERLRN